MSIIIGSTDFLRTHINPIPLDRFHIYLVQDTLEEKKRLPVVPFASPEWKKLKTFSKSLFWRFVIRGYVLFGAQFVAFGCDSTRTWIEYWQGITQGPFLDCNSPVPVSLIPPRLVSLGHFTVTHLRRIRTSHEERNPKRTFLSAWDN